MWVFTETGFVSAVRKDSTPDVITVRARDRKSLESLAGLAQVEIAKSPNGDYPYRLFVATEVWAEWVSLVAINVDYDNFKSHVAQTRGYDYAHELSRVWSVMLDTEDEDARPH